MNYEARSTRRRISIPAGSYRPRRTAMLVAFFVGTLVAFATPVTETASAGPYVIADCPAAGSSDAGPLSVFGGSQGAKASCAGGEGDWIGPRGASMSPNSLDGVQVSAPPGITIRGAQIWWYVPRSSGGASTYALAAINGGTVGESQTPLEQRGTPSVFSFPSGTTYLTLTDYCAQDSGPQGCSFGSSGAANLQVFGSRLTLEEDHPPGGNTTGGGLQGGEVLTGPQSLSFQARDGESGLRLVQLRVDGSVAAQNDYGPTCPYTNFAACPEGESGALTWNTASVADGRHHLELIAIDAAQNSAVIYAGTITTKNAASNSAPPSIEGAKAPLLGVGLTATPGSWSAPTGAGPLDFAYQWEQCDSQGGSCWPIPGASEQTYTPVEGDLAHTLRVLVSASDSDGLAQATSEATATVSAPPTTGPSIASSGITTLPLGAPTTSAGTPALVQLSGPSTITRPFAHRAFTLTGRVLGAEGQPLAGAVLDVLSQPLGGSLRLLQRVVSGSDGGFAAAIPPGPSRMIEVGYRASPEEHTYSAIARLGESVRAGVKLKIEPRWTSPEGLIQLSGNVEGPVPRHGVIVDLLVHYRGRWVPFRTPRTDAAGHFESTYQFEGSVGRFPFRAEVKSDQAGFAFDRGMSSVVHVAAG